MEEFGVVCLSSSQVSRAAKQLDEELAAWRNRPLDEIKYLILDARYEKMRHGGIVRDGEEDKKMIRGIIFPTNMLSAIGIGPDERRRVLGVSVALSEAEVHWRGSLDGLVSRGLRGVTYVVSDDHAGLRAARRAVLGGAIWQRCRSSGKRPPTLFSDPPHLLAQNAIHHAPQCRDPQAHRQAAEIDLDGGRSRQGRNRAGRAVASYRDTASKLADWPECPRGLAVFTLPERKRLVIQPDRARVHLALKRRTFRVRRENSAPRCFLILLTPQPRSRGQARWGAHAGAKRRMGRLTPLHAGGKAGGHVQRYQRGDDDRRTVNERHQP